MTREPHDTEAPVAPAPLRALVVDDEPLARDELIFLLEQCGDVEVVEQAEDAPDALRKLSATRADVAFVDLRMPGPDGIALTEAIKAQRPQTRVVMVTTYRSTVYLLRSLSAGAAGFVLKDVPREELLNTVRAVAAGAAGVDRDFLQSVLRDLDEQSQSDVIGSALTEPLTGREMDVLRLLVEGMTNQAIAHALTLSPATVKGYIQSIFQKLAVADRTQAAVKAIRLGLVK